MHTSVSTEQTARSMVRAVREDDDCAPYRSLHAR